ncbi:MAG: 3-dehydroquinate synthase [Bacteroidales bacterium]
MEQQKVIFTSDMNDTLLQTVRELPHDKLYILTDTHTKEACLPLLKSFTDQTPYQLISIEAGDTAKNIESISHIWMVLSTSGATRNSLMLNLGGGMITDIGGFAAASFKRGIPFINIPTSLLGAVDAAVGGKTGINFNGLKNEIGTFSPARYVLISTEFFQTLDTENLLSGYAEMLKHGLLHSPEAFERVISYDIRSRDPQKLLELLRESVEIKRHIVTVDPFEKGIRKALNLGHTAGHAFESYCLHHNKPILHGYAVAWGLVCELILSHRQCGFPLHLLTRTAEFVRENYGPLFISCKAYEELYEYMTHDKKNVSGTINFTLLRNVGEIEINQTASRENINIMFDIYRDLFRI